MTNDQRPPVFELHIKPMFRLLDRDHMLTLFGPGVDLWELERVWEMRNDIIARLRRDGDRNMPGLQVGGPWPAEWIDLFERWTQNPTDDDIGHHLTFATPTGAYQLEVDTGDRRRLRAEVMAATAGCRAWFELQSVSATRREYTLYLEPAHPAPPPPATPTALDALETFVKNSADTLVIHDGSGTRELAIP